jgi:hypothetical protein
MERPLRHILLYGDSILTSQLVYPDTSDFKKGYPVTNQDLVGTTLHDKLFEYLFKHGYFTLINGVCGRLATERSLSARYYQKMGSINGVQDFNRFMTDNIMHNFGHIFIYLGLNDVINIPDLTSDKLIDSLLQYTQSPLLLTAKQVPVTFIEPISIAYDVFEDEETRNANDLIKQTFNQLEITGLLVIRNPWQENKRSSDRIHLDIKQYERFAMNLAMLMFEELQKQGSY